MAYRKLVALCLMATLGLPAMAQDATSGSFGIEWGTGRVICTGDYDSNVDEAADSSYARSAAWDRMVFGEVGGGCAPDLTPLDGGTWGKTQPFEGTDEQGLSAEFVLYVLHDRFSWALGSASRITDDGAPADLASVLSTPQFSQAFCSAPAAFSVGAASHEGAPAPNHRLARQRGQHIVELLTTARRNCAPGQIPILFAVNLGQHQNRSGCTTDSDCAGTTGPQRRVVIVAAEEASIGVNLEAALRSAIEGQQVFRGFSVDDYDLFEVSEF